MRNEELPNIRTLHTGADQNGVDCDVARLISRLREDNKALRQLNCALHHDMGGTQGKANIPASLEH